MSLRHQSRADWVGAQCKCALSETRSSYVTSCSETWGLGCLGLVGRAEALGHRGAWRACGPLLSHDCHMKAFPPILICSPLGGMVRPSAAHDGMAKEDPSERVQSLI